MGGGGGGGGGGCAAWRGRPKQAEGRVPWQTEGLREWNRGWGSEIELAFILDTLPYLDDWHAPRPVHRNGTPARPVPSTGGQLEGSRAIAIGRARQRLGATALLARPPPCPWQASTSVTCCGRAHCGTVCRQERQLSTYVRRLGSNMATGQRGGGWVVVEVEGSTEDGWPGSG